uniref:Thy-1 membrane glycoprotein n=1 Tax=Salvator merianae TaxID=96440 RepID=A0A8D0E8Y5_SALMN
MKSSISILVLVTVLHVTYSQRIKDLKACLSGQTLRVDCYYERKTNNPLTYEFRLNKDNSNSFVLASNERVPNAQYKKRVEVNANSSTVVCLQLKEFSKEDEGIYMCRVKITSDYEGVQMRNISVIKDNLPRCAGISLLIQNTSWLLLLLLSLPLLQAVDFVSL